MRGERRPDAELLWGVHPVEEALLTRSREIERILVAREGGARTGRLLRLARQAGVPVSHVPRDVLAREAGRGAVHQGVVATVSPLAYADADGLSAAAAAREDGLLVLLDRVTDPRNVGAILRSCAAAGAAGVLLGEGCAGLVPAAVKSSAGTSEHLPVAREPRPGPRIDDLVERGLRAVALDPQGDLDWDAVDLRGRILIVAGGEGGGLRPGLSRRVAMRVRIPLAPGIDSLNVSVAVAVLLFEIVRQRRAASRVRP